jgi:hypothetical protein
MMATLAAPHLLAQIQILIMHLFVLQAVQVERGIQSAAARRAVPAVRQRILWVKIGFQEATVKMVPPVTMSSLAQVPVEMVPMAVAMAVLR